MKAFVIRLPDSPGSVVAVANLRKSSEKVGNSFDIERFEATTPGTVEAELKALDIEWNYPEKPGEKRTHKETGLVLSAYKTRNPLARRACFASHARLWAECARGEETFLILEEDALFVKTTPGELIASRCEQLHRIIGINNPKRATRRAGRFHNVVRKAKADGQFFCPVPGVDHDIIPQGLAGNSAYFIPPKMARVMLFLARTHGGWPNDALMCRQLLPNHLEVTTTYYTIVQQGRASTLA